MWGLWWTKWHWGRFSPSTSVSLANSHSINCSTFHHHLSSGVGIIRQLVADVPIGVSLTPPQETKKKKKLNCLENVHRRHVRQTTLFKSCKMKRFIICTIQRIIRIISSRRFRSTQNVEQVGKMTNTYILVGKSEGMRFFDSQQWIILEWILMN
jgi:hypothetical protein